MKRWLSLLPLLLAALWLPAAAVAAVAMPFCQHHGSQATAPGQGSPSAHQQAMAADPASMPCHGDHAVAQGDHASANGDDAPPADSGLDCDQCGFCQLASGSAVPATLSATAVPVAGHEAASPPKAAFSSHIPEQPSQPPKRPA